MRDNDARAQRVLSDALSMLFEAHREQDEILKRHLMTAAEAHLLFVCDMQRLKEVANA